jgi:hypothetical protein
MKLLGIFHVSNIRETLRIGELDLSFLKFSYSENRRILRAKIQFSHSESFTNFLGTLLLKK